MSEIWSDPKKGLSYIWSIASIIILGYIVYRWGNEKEILTLIIGLIGGTILGSIMGLWFGGTNTKTNHPLPEGTTSATITGDVEVKADEVKPQP